MNNYSRYNEYKYLCNNLCNTHKIIGGLNISYFDFQFDYIRIINKLQKISDEDLTGLDTTKCKTLARLNPYALKKKDIKEMISCLQELRHYFKTLFTNLNLHDNRIFENIFRVNKARLELLENFLGNKINDLKQEEIEEFLESIDLRKYNDTISKLKNDIDNLFEVYQELKDHLKRFKPFDNPQQSIKSIKEYMQLSYEQRKKIILSSS